MSPLGKRIKDGKVKSERQDYRRRTLCLARRYLANHAAQIAHGQTIADALTVDKPAHELFKTLSFDWDTAEPLPPDLVSGLVADEDVTLLGGHGGVGKGFLTLQIYCAVALGTEVLGHTAQQRPVLYYSAEDGRKRLGQRMRKLAEACSDSERVLLKRNLRIIDATELSVLYGEQPKGGPTGDYALLQRMVEQFDPQLVVIDGASDTFDGNEIHRRDVRGFVKALKRVHPKRRVGVLLIVHIDRASARGHSSNDEGYAGNTQWHNSCRRRLYSQVKTEKDNDADTVLN